MRRGIAALRLLGAVVGTGVLAGVAAGALVLLLHGLQWVASGYATHAHIGGVELTAPWRRVVAPLVGGLVVGLGWWWLRRRTRTATLDAAIERPQERLEPGPTAADAVLQIAAVASGASVGREVAPRQLAATFTDLLARWWRLDDRMRTTLMTAGAAGGLAAVYNVPVAGAIFAFEVMGLALGWGRALMTLAITGIAAMTAWPVVGARPSYEFARETLQGVDVVVAALIVPGAMIVGAAFAWLAKTSTAASATLSSPRVTWTVVPWMVAAMGTVGLLSIWWPLLPGNGRPELQSYLLAENLTIAGAATMLVLKPLATALCFRASIKGGKIAPALAVGGSLGALIAMLVGHGAGVPVAVIVGAGAVLAWTEHAPLMASVFAVELTHPPVPVAALILATGLCVGAARWALGRGLTRRAGRPDDEPVTAGEPSRS